MDKFTYMYFLHICKLHLHTSCERDAKKYIHVYAKFTYVQIQICTQQGLGVKAKYYTQNLHLVQGYALKGGNRNNRDQKNIQEGILSAHTVTSVMYVNALPMFRLMWRISVNNKFSSETLEFSYRFVIFCGVWPQFQFCENQMKIFLPQNWMYFRK